jgi:hypothetical protein
MSKRVARMMVVTAFAAILLGAGCSFNTASKGPTGEQPLKDGQTLGKIDRLPGGTAVASSVVTLLGLSCVNGKLLVRTNLQSIAGKMDCAQQIPQATLDKFYGQSVSIVYANGRLRIDSVSAGTIDLPVQDATVTELNATP